MEKAANMARGEKWRVKKYGMEWKMGNSFFSLSKCKVVFVRWYLTCKVVPYKKILVENERPYKKPCKVVPYKKNYLKMSAYIKSHVGLHLTCKVVPYKK